MTKEEALRELRAIRRYREGRDEIVRAAHAAGISKRQIITETTLSKPTVYSILKERDMDSTTVTTPDGTVTITRADGVRLAYGDSESDISRGDRVIVDEGERPGTVEAIGTSGNTVTFTVLLDDGERLGGLLPRELTPAGYDWSKQWPDGDCVNGWCETKEEMDKVVSEFEAG